MAFITGSISSLEYFEIQDIHGYLLWVSAEKVTQGMKENYLSGPHLHSDNDPKFDIQAEMKVCYISN